MQSVFEIEKGFEKTTQRSIILTYLTRDIIIPQVCRVLQKD